MKSRPPIILLALIIATFLLGGTARAQTSATLYAYWGQLTYGAGFNSPAGIAFDSNYLYVADKNSNHILKFTFNGNFSGAFAWGLDKPTDIAIDTGGNVYVSTPGNNCVIKFDSSGNVKASWAGLNNPGGIAIDDTGAAFVADTGNNRIVKLGPSGQYSFWGNGQFSTPAGLAFLATGTKKYLYVADSGNHRIRKLDGATGEVLSQWGSYGAGPGQFSSPTGIAVDNSGAVFVADTGNQRIQKFDGNGAFLCEWGAAGTGNYGFTGPRGIAAADKIYVCNAGGNRVQAFQSYTATADAGPDVTTPDLTPGLDPITVTLSGGNSSPAGRIVSYQWTQTSGTPVTLADPTKAVTSFTAPVVGTNGASLTFQLAVTFITGQVKDDCLVNVTWVNLAPTSSTGGNRTVAEGSLVTLHGSGADPDDGVASYLWTQTGGPAVTLSDPQAQEPTFIAPDVGVAGAALTFQLKVTDSHGLSATDQCIVNVTWVNAPPKARAGADQTVDENTGGVTLDGAGSDDPDGDNLTYLWSLVSVEGAIIGDVVFDPNVPQPAFTAPEVGRDGANLNFRLTVTDVYGARDSATCTVKVRNVNTPPEVEAGLNLLVLSKDVAGTILTGTARDGDFDPLTYRWLEGDQVLAAGNVGADGTAPLNLANIPLAVGAHTLTLEVSDGLAAATDSMVLTIGNSPPTVAPSGGGVFRVDEYSTKPVILGGQVFDYDGDVVTYQWFEGATALSGADSSGAVKTLPGGGQGIDLPEFITTSLAVGLHSLTLVADDGFGNKVSSQPVTVTIIAGGLPTLAPKADKTILWPPNKTMAPVLIAANASDGNGGPIALTAAVACIDNGQAYGKEGVDWTKPVINGDGTISLQLSADRLGKGTGRTYTVTITATDTWKNRSSANVQIKVPHDQGKN